MSKIDDIKSSFERDLDEQIKQREQQLQTELKKLSQALLGEVRPRSFGELSLLDTDMKVISTEKSLDIPQVDHQARVVLDRSPELNEIDSLFTSTFNLDAYYPTYRLAYPTVYCETLDEFFTPIVNRFDLSSQARQAALQGRIEYAQKIAEMTGGGGTLGYNLPGEGCYLNGWLFTVRHNLSSQAEGDGEDIGISILETAVHEKLGHGFLQEYSALGAVKSSLGLVMADLARKFGIRDADDPLSSLRGEQASLLFMVSQLLEEGWATWLETFLLSRLFETEQPSIYAWNTVIAAVEKLTSSFPEDKEEQGAIFSALYTLFGSGEKNIYELHQAVMVIEFIGGEYDDYFGDTLGQPLRYVVGEMLFQLAAYNLGASSLPYAALIAANVTLEPSQMSLSDLRVLLGKDPRLHPDARMAALNHLKLEEPGNVSELAQQAEQVLSFSVPSELKR